MLVSSVGSPPSLSLEASTSLIRKQACNPVRHFYHLIKYFKDRKIKELTFPAQVLDPELGEPG